MRLATLPAEEVKLLLGDRPHTDQDQPGEQEPHPDAEDHQTHDGLVLGVVEVPARTRGHEVDATEEEEHRGDHQEGRRDAGEPHPWRGLTSGLGS